MQKQFKNGLCLMKAYPFHLGHKHLIDSAIEQCDTVHVMVCSLKREKIAGELRYQWVKETYRNNPNVNVIHCDDENPQHPPECTSVDEFYNKYWVPTVYKHVKELDAVFTSEDYGDEFASYLGVKHVLVDKARTAYPVSGTSVRENPYANWGLIPDNVKKYFMKKIVILGPESVGKSTMVKKLAEHLGCKYIEEFGRTYTELFGTNNLEIFDFESIAHWHNVEIENAEIDKYLIVDTEAITTKIFAEMYLGKRESESKFIDEIISEQHFDLYLVLNVDVLWVDDGTRDFQEGREEHLNAIISNLEERGLEYKLISGDNYNERFEKALEEVKKLGYL
jgi:HTH-type transcriptional repressor of NAD biosynthesis genes